jgi:hypothetical protein
MKSRSVEKNGWFATEDWGVAAFDLHGRRVVRFYWSFQGDDTQGLLEEIDVLRGYGRVFEIHWFLAST